MLGELGILILLIFCNSVFAATEIAIISVNQNKMRKKAEEGDKKAARIRDMAENPSNALAAIQIGISIIALFSGAFAAKSFSDELTLHLLLLGVKIPEPVLLRLSIILITLILSYFTLVLGELVPKRIAMKKADSIALAMINPIYYLCWLARPFVKILSISTNAIAKLLGVDIETAKDDVTEEEIRLMVDAGGDAGAIDESEMEMINNIFEFDDKTAGDICTHRTDIVALPIDAGEEELLKVLINEKFSRIPVYEENIDNIIGILHIKDVLKYIIGKNLHEVDLSQIIREPHFVPFSIKTDELFEDMQKNKRHVAVVLDEYGGTLGIATMEDLIEEVMGNIFDEYDEETADISMLDDDTFVISGSACLTEVSDYLSVDLPVDECNTLSGFIVSQLGRIPAIGENPEVDYGELHFIVSKVEEKRITEVLVQKAETFAPAQ
ncbi:MAG: hemolysin family protein [Clostridiales bacterium]|nr:hemolysin family protein [Clostridiales bacterium]